ERIDGDQFEDTSDQAGLLAELAQRSVFGMLAELDAAPRQRPRAGSFRDAAQSAQQQSRRVVYAHVVGRDALNLRRLLAHSFRSRRQRRRAARAPLAARRI